MSASAPALKGIALGALVPGAADFKVGIVHTEWNAAVIDALLAGARAELARQGVREENVVVVKVRAEGRARARAGARAAARARPHARARALTPPRAPAPPTLFARRSRAPSSSPSPPSSCSRAYTPSSRSGASSRARRCTLSTFARPSRRASCG